MITPVLTPKLITQKQFERAASKWLRVLSKPDYEILEQSFTTSQGRPKLVTFPIYAIKYLVSTIGASHIEARFVLMQDDLDQRWHYFTVVLYATDAKEARLSAYYLADRPMRGDTTDQTAAKNTSDAEPTTLGSSADPTSANLLS